MQTSKMPMDIPAGALACRLCGAPVRNTVVDLGCSPLCNNYLSEEELSAPETFYPLHLRVCRSCYLVQLPALATPEAIFSDYRYFSSYSSSWLAHCRAYVDDIVERLGLGTEAQVVELASNDGYLLQYFKQRGIPCLGVEPAENVAQDAIDKGIPTRTEFFGAAFARELRTTDGPADLLIANNVLAHVPDVRGFVEGMRILLSPEGTLTVEVPHLLELMEHNQFDTIYHEHFSYFSLRVLKQLFEAHALTIHDVESLATHGGSLRLHIQHANVAPEVSDRVHEVLSQEDAAGLQNLSTYHAFAARVYQTKRALLSFLIQCKNEGAEVVGYGAPGKAATLLNFCGIREDLLSFTVDRSPHKQGRYIPGVRIPIREPEVIAEAEPAYVLILPWNLKEEIMTQMQHIRSWGGQFAVPIPEVQVAP